MCGQCQLAGRPDATACVLSRAGLTRASPQFGTESPQCKSTRFGSCVVCRSASGRSTQAPQPGPRQAPNKRANKGGGTSRLPHRTEQQTRKTERHSCLRTFCAWVFVVSTMLPDDDLFSAQSPRRLALEQSHAVPTSQQKAYDVTPLMSPLHCPAADRGLVQSHGVPILQQNR